MTDTERAVLAHAASPEELQGIAENLCGAAAAFNAARPCQRARWLASQAAELLELRAVVLECRSGSGASTARS